MASPSFFIHNDNKTLGRNFDYINTQNVLILLMYQCIITCMTKAKNEQIGMIVKTALGVIATLSLVYGMVIVPSMEASRTNEVIERGERSVYFGCELQARNVLAQVNSQAEEEITQEQQEQVLNGEFATCIVTQGFTVDELADKYGPEEQ